MVTRETLLRVTLWNALFCSPGSIFGFAALSIPIDVFLVTGGPMLSIGTAVVAPCLDAFGPRLVAICGAATSFIGYVILASLNSGDTSLWAHLSMALMATGGLGPYLGGFSIGNLFEHPERPISKITGLFVLAGINFAVFRSVGLSHTEICLGMAGLQALGGFLSLMTYPRWPHLPGHMGHVLLAQSWKHSPDTSCPDSLGPPAVTLAPRITPSIDLRDDDIRRFPIAIVVPSYWRRKQKRERSDSLRMSLQESLLSGHRRMSRTLSDIRLRSQGGLLNNENLLVQVMSLEYIGITTWFALHLTWGVYFFANVGPQVNDPTFCVLCLYLPTVCGACISLRIGHVIGWAGYALSTLIASACCILMFLLAASQNLTLGYVAIFVFALQRSLNMAVYFSYVPVTFGSANYGRLIGITTIFAGAFGFINGPLVQWSGLTQSSQAVCPVGGLACKSWNGCARVNFLLAASMIPMLFYSMWLHRRPYMVDGASTASTPASSPMASPIASQSPPWSPTRSPIVTLS